MDNNPMEKRMLGTVVWLLAHFGAGVGLLFVLVWVVPDFAKVFADLAVQLPLAAQAVITFSWWGRMYWWLAIPLGLVDAGVLFGLRSLPTGARWLSTLWAVLVLLGAIVLLGAAILAVALPYLELHRALTEAPAP